MDFCNALNAMKMSVPITRSSWGDRKQIVSLKSSTFSKEMRMIDPKDVGGYNYIKLPYSFRSEDILATDWEVPRPVQSDT